MWRNREKEIEEARRLVELLQFRTQAELDEVLEVPEELLAEFGPICRAVVKGIVIVAQDSALRKSGEVYGQGQEALLSMIKVGYHLGSMDY